MIRNTLGLTQRKMAKLINITYQGWQKYESGENKPGSDILESLANLGFNINWILTGQGDMHPDWAKDHYDFSTTEQKRTSQLARMMVDLQSKMRQDIMDAVEEERAKQQSNIILDREMVIESRAAYAGNIVSEPDIPSVQSLIRDLMDIMDSNDVGTKIAIAQNIVMFKESVMRKKALDLADNDFKIQGDQGMAIQQETKQRAGGKKN